MTATTQQYHKFYNMYWNARAAQHGLALIRTCKSNRSGRHTATSTRMFFKTKKYLALSTAVSKRRGHTNTGRLTVYTKGRVSKKRGVLFLKKTEGLLKFIQPVGTIKDVQTGKIAALCLCASGTVVYLPLTNRMFFGRLHVAADFCNRAIACGINPLIKKYRVCEILVLLKNFRNICWVSPSANRGATIARAAGAAATTLVRRGRLTNKVSPILLPSQKIKYVDALSVVLLGFILPKKKNLFKNTRAGYWRKLGKKPTVRGIVKNPVDHPHGGRTKTVCWQRTPWGKSTK